MKRYILPAIMGAFLLSGCTSSGAFLSANQTIVNLNEGNYVVTATDISGESESGYILGLSYSTGLTANTLAIARVDGTGKLYAEALENLWENYESDHGMITDRKLALSNVRYDTDILNLIVYTKVILTVRADVIEFE